MHCTTLERDPKRGVDHHWAPFRLCIYTYTWAPHNVNGEIAHCALHCPKVRRPAEGLPSRVCVHKPCACSILRAGMLRLGKSSHSLSPPHRQSSKRCAAASPCT